MGGNIPGGSLMGWSFPDTENKSDESGSVKMRYQIFFCFLNLNQKRALEILTVVPVMMRKKVLNIK